MWTLMPSPLFCLPYDICCVPQSVQSSRGRPLQSDQHDSASPSSPSLCCPALLILDQRLAYKQFTTNAVVWWSAVRPTLCLIFSFLFVVFFSLHHIVETWASITCEASVSHLAFWMVHTSHYWTLLPVELKHMLQREEKKALKSTMCSSKHV